MPLADSLVIKSIIFFPLKLWPNFMLETVWPVFSVVAKKEFYGTGIFFGIGKK
jgi:hypothetical protein